MAGQSIGDRIVAAQHTIIGSDMSKSVCKATTSEVMGPKKKHLDYLNALTNEANVNIPELADILVERSKQPKWVIVFKSLITTHHLMCYGNERFLQHLASRNSLFNLIGFLDRAGLQGYDMSTYIKRYAKYLNEKAISYRMVAYDFTRVRRGKNDGVVRSLDSENLLKTLPVLQKQLDALLEFDARPNELTNGVINAAFMLLFKDLIRLFACYNDGIINLLEKYFEMKKSHCREALDIYKKFLTRMNKVSELLKVAEQVGIDKGDIPDLTKAPSSLLDALEQHLASLEGKKPVTKPVAPDTSAFYHNFESSTQKDTFDVKNTLEEEEKRLTEFKQQRLQETDPTAGLTKPDSVKVPPLTNSQTQQNSDGVDLLDASSFTIAPQASQPSQDFFEQLAAPAAPITGQPAMNTGHQQNFGFAQDPFSTSQPAVIQQPNLFNTSPFGNPSSASMSGTDLLTPTVSGSNTQQPVNSAIGNQVSGTNLESSLANVMANLNVGGNQRANLEFQPRQEKKLTGGNSFVPVTVAPTTNFNPSPMHNMYPMQMPVGPMQPQMGMTYPMMQQQMMRPPMHYQQMQPAPSQQQFNPNNPFGSMF